MLADPDFEKEFYETQNKKMQERYVNYFDKWKISWKKYRNYVFTALRHNPYWIWVFLCGFEKFIQEEGFKKNLKDILYKDADSRIRRIIGDFNLIQEYVRNL